MSFQLPIIETKREFDSLFDQLEKQGFHFHRPESAHANKVVKVVHDQNKLNLDISIHLTETLWKSAQGSYVKLEKLAIEFFSKFTPQDRLNELIKKVYLTNVKEIYTKLKPKEIKCSPPQEFEGYEISMEDFDYDYWRLYDLSQRTLRLHFDHQLFPELLRLTIAPAFKLVSTDVGLWHSSAGISYKRFQNGSVVIKHPKINELKALYKKQLLARQGTAVKTQYYT